MPARRPSFIAALITILLILLTGHLTFGTTNITVDNEDGRIIFSPSGWVLQPNPQIGPAINGSVTLTRTSGSWFTLTFAGKQFSSFEFCPTDLLLVSV